MEDEVNCSSDQTRKCLRTGKFANLLLTGTTKKLFFALGNSDLFLISIFFVISIKMISSLFKSFVYGQNLYNYDGETIAILHFII